MVWVALMSQSREARSEGRNCNGSVIWVFEMCSLSVMTIDCWSFHKTRKTGDGHNGSFRGQKISRWL